MSSGPSGEGAENPYVVAAKTLYGIEEVPPSTEGTGAVAAACAVRQAALAEAQRDPGRDPALMRAGEHNVILDVIQHQQAAMATIFDPRVAPRQTYSMVTFPLNGPGAGLIFDQVTKAPRLCTRYHATPQQSILHAVKVRLPREWRRRGWRHSRHGACNVHRSPRKDTDAVGQRNQVARSHTASHKELHGSKTETWNDV